MIINRQIIASILLVVSLTACGVNSQNPIVSIKSGAAQTGCISDGKKLMQLTFEQQGDQALVGGDMLIPLRSMIFGPQEQTLGLARESSTVRLWPNRRVPYLIPADFPFKTEIAHMVSEWSKAGISWVEKTAADVDYVSFEVNLTANYCGQSQLGRVGGKQVLNMPTLDFATRVSCKMKHVMLHETAHALGFMHEHQRSDRDAYVKFDGDITGQTWLQKLSGSVNQTEFDINSVTMYGTENTYPNRIHTIDGANILLKEVLSSKDIAGAAAIYPAPVVVATASPTPSPTVAAVAAVTVTPTATATASTTTASNNNPPLTTSTPSTQQVAGVISNTTDVIQQTPSTLDPTISRVQQSTPKNSDATTRSLKQINCGVMP